MSENEHEDVEPPPAGEAEPDPLAEAQGGKGYGLDEGERDEALDE